MPEYDATLQYPEVPGFPGYKINSEGTIWCILVRRRLGCRKGSTSYLSIKWRKKVVATGSHGYLTAKLSKEGQEFQRLLHRLVLEAFVGPCPPGKECCHADGNRANCRVSNLRWDTRKNNHADKKKHGTQQIGSKANMAKLNEEKVHQILLELKSGRMGIDIAAQFNVTPSLISCIRKRKCWTHVSI